MMMMIFFTISKISQILLYLLLQFVIIIYFFTFKLTFLLEYTIYLSVLSCITVSQPRKTP